MNPGDWVLIHERKLSPQIKQLLTDLKSGIETVVSTGHGSGTFRRHVLPLLGRINRALGVVGEQDGRQG
jgi:hypothetical protein